MADFVITSCHGVTNHLASPFCSRCTLNRRALGALQPRAHQMMHLLLAIACTTPSELQADLPSDVPTGTREAPEADRLVPVGAGEAQLVLSFPPDVAGFWELRAYRLGGDEGTWVGTPYATGAVLTDRETLELGRLPPRADRGFDPTSYVTYAIALRAEDGGAEPGLYVGLAPERLVFVGEVPPEGASAGWNLARDYDSGDPVWLPMTDGVVIGENLYGHSTLDLAGGTTVPVVPGTHLDLATSDAADALTAFDAPITPDWSLSLGGPPPVEALTESEPVLGAIYSIFAYDDVGGDNTRTDEPLLGTACFHAAAARVTWYAYAYDLPTALDLQRVGARAGWDLSIDTPNGPSSVPVDDHGALTLQLTCG